MTVELPPMPNRIARLPKDERGFPVPWFVAWIDGKPDFRVVDAAKLPVAHHHHRCWICGDVMGVHQVYPIGPMCLINRVTSEPASHRTCAEFALRACPFLTKPRMRRNDKSLPEESYTTGIAIARNPGVTCLYEARGAEPFSVPGGRRRAPALTHILFRLAPPTRVDWWTEGREASRAEVWAAIESGYPTLLAMARQEGTVAELERMRDKALEYLPPQIFVEKRA